MKTNKIIKVNNPYFSPNFIEQDGKIIFSKKGIWFCSWTERVIKGFKVSEEFKKKPFKTRKQAQKYTTHLLVLFNS